MTRWQCLFVATILPSHPQLGSLHYIWFSTRFSLKTVEAKFWPEDGAVCQIFFSPLSKLQQRFVPVPHEQKSPFLFFYLLMPHHWFIRQRKLKVNSQPFCVTVIYFIFIFIFGSVMLSSYHISHQSKAHDMWVVPPHDGIVVNNNHSDINRR